MVLDGYIRVSQVGGRTGESFISPAVQREQIEGWARSRTVVLGQVFEEFDQSGARRDRPLLARAIERVEAGESHGIVVAKLDRFGRSLVDGLTAIERIRAAGGTFVSVQDGLDLDTDTGKLVLRVMLSMAEWELDRVRGEWNGARERAIARGMHLGPCPPTGYVRDRRGRLRPDAVAGPAMTEVFRRRAAGASISELCRFLEARGVVTPYGNVGWCRTSLARVLTNRAYLGEVRSGTYVNAAAHRPLVDPATWQQAQTPRVIGPREGSLQTLLGGLLRCSACRMALAYQSRANGNAYYACHCFSSAGRCPAPARVSGSVIEPHIESEVFRLLAARRPRPAADRNLALAQQRVETAERALAVYRDNPRVIETLGPQRFADGLAARAAQVERALLRLAAERSRRDPDELPGTDELRAAWPTMSVRERRAVIARVIDCAFVDRGRRNAASRTLICRRGDAPLDLPRRGSKRHELRAFRAQA